jgi:hypothetical protein
VEEAGVDGQCGVGGCRSRRRPTVVAAQASARPGDGRRWVDTVGGSERGGRWLGAGMQSKLSELVRAGART